MNKPEFHYKSSGRCSEYSFSFELMSIVGRKFFCKSLHLKMDIVTLVVETDSLKTM